MNGGLVLEGYVPDVDATIVTRIWTAGGHDLGKVHLRVLCLLWGQPHPRGRAVPHNPREMGYRRVGVVGHRRQASFAGGDRHGHRGGGWDQGGSIRIPPPTAAHSGWEADARNGPPPGSVPHREHTSTHGADDGDGGRTNALLSEGCWPGARRADPRQLNVKTRVHETPSPADARDMKDRHA